MEARKCTAGEGVSAEPAGSPKEKRASIAVRTKSWLWKMVGFLILVGFQLLGIGLHKLGVPLPGAVLGLLLFVTTLAIEIVKVEWVERTANFLIRHMLLLFIPLVAGLTQMTADLRRDGVALIASLVVSLLCVLLTTGGLAHFLLRDVHVPDPSAAENK
jgi:holin-like protein